MTAVLTDHTDEIAYLTLNRPQCLNAINKDVLQELDAGLERAETDDRVRVILLTGAGSAFCAGDDLVELAESPVSRAETEAGIGTLQRITERIMLGSKPVVCAVNGWAIGGGATWPLNADIAVWSREAKIRFPEAGHGLFPSGGATWLLEQFCGPHRAMEILLHGETLDGAQLIDDRIAKHLVAPETLLDEAHQSIKRLLNLPGDTLKRYKSARQASFKVPLERALEAERQRMIEAVLALTESGLYPEIKRHA